MNTSTLRTSIIGLLLAGSVSAANAQFMVSEVQVCNTDQIVDPSFNYGQWVEIYNNSSNYKTINGWYLSDDPENLKKARISRSEVIKPGEYVCLWLGNKDKYSPNQIDLKFDVDGGTIYLSNSLGNLQCQLDYPAGIPRTSWACSDIEAGTYSYAYAPTPGRSNTSSAFATERLEAPVIDKPSQIFSNSVTMRVTIPQGCTLRYTSNGSTPTPTNGSTSTTGTFTISSTSVYRFMLYKDGYLPSPVVTRTMIKRDKDFDIPVIAICSDYKNFYGDSLGIFTKGVNGRPGRGQSGKCNWNMDWERPANFEYYLPDGTCVVNQEVDIDRCGGWSRAWEPWSFKIKASKEYEGAKSIDYQFFDSKPYIKNKALQVRNGGNDNWCRVKDPALQQIVITSGIYADCQAYQPVAHYVNGTYKGTINLRQPNNKDFAYADYGLDDDDIDFFEMSPDSGYVQVRGDKRAWNDLYELSRTCTNASSYKRICEMLDIDEYINQMAVELYLGNWDWPQNNVKGFKSRLDGGKWHFVLFDLDGSFNNTANAFTEFARKQTYTFDRLYDCSTYNITAEIEFVTVFLNLLNNDQFRKQFIDAFCLVAGSVFSPDRCRQIINDLCERVAPMQSTYNWGSPWSTGNDLISKLSSDRQSIMTDALKNYSKFKLSGTTKQKVKLQADLNQAHILVNDQPVPTDFFDGYLFAPVTVKAVAPEGYSFAGWRQASLTSSNLLSTKSTWTYYDKGSLDGKNWTSPTYQTTGWKTGKAPLGYFTGGTRDYQTTLGYGSDANNKYPTYYFRTNVTLDKDPADGDIFTIDYTVDDGCIIYVNGTEALRYNMPSGNVTFNTFASSYAQNNPDNCTGTLPTSLFHKGSNTIAVEVHNNNANSTDIYWEASIEMQSNSGSTIICATPEYTLPTSGTQNLIACFEQIDESQLTGTATHPIVINEVSAGNETFANDYFKRNDWLELYNTTSQDIDITGMYLTDNAAKPTKFQFTKTANESLIIPAHGYKIVWCDKLESMSEVHASFKLGNEDESVLILTAADQSWADTLIYCAHASSETVGRYPDGSDNLYVLNVPTIGKANVMTLAAVDYVQPEIDFSDYIEEIAADDLEAADDHYCVYDISGQLVAEGDGPVRISGLKRGAYIVKRGKESIKIFR
ncbi:MAG: CotH kinase family protein [Bacteroidales bacterium]|nr:CotH kinase family protein [Candidatus Liminaster caballi]